MTHFKKIVCMVYKLEVTHFLILSVQEISWWIFLGACRMPILLQKAPICITFVYFVLRAGTWWPNRSSSLDIEHRNATSETSETRPRPEIEESGQSGRWHVGRDSCFTTKGSCERQACCQFKNAAVTTKGMFFFPWYYLFSNDDKVGLPDLSCWLE